MSIYETHKPSQGKGDYLKLKDGDRVKVRFASNPAAVTYDGKKMRYQWIVLNRENKKVQIYEAGPQVFSQLAQLYPEWGEPTEFDVTISRTGSGQFDTTYTVTPSPKSDPLTDDERKQVMTLLEGFATEKRRWLADIENDGVLPEPLKSNNDDAPEGEPIPLDDIPPEFN